MNHYSATPSEGSLSPDSTLPCSIQHTPLVPSVSLNLDAEKAYT